MKRLSILFGLLLALSAHGINVTNYPMRTTVQPDDWFWLSNVQDKTNYSVSWAALSNQVASITTLVAATNVPILVAGTNINIALNGLTNTIAGRTQYDYHVITNAPWISMSSSNWVDVRAFGALGGSTDDTVPFQTALNSGNTIFVPNVTNFTIGTVYLTNGARIFGYGSEIDFKGGVNNAAMFECATNSNISMNGLELHGGDYSLIDNRTGSDGRIGLRPYCYGSGSEIYNVTICGFDFGVYPLGDKWTTNSHTSSTLNIHDVTCYSNYCGVRLHSPAYGQIVEYLELRNMNLFANFIGYFESAGNNTLAESKVSDNINGIVINGAMGVNPNHGIISATRINHNQNGLCFTNVIVVVNSMGVLITGCRIHNSGNSYFDNCNGIQILNSYIDLGYIRCYGASSNNFIIDNMYAGVYTNTGSWGPQNFGWVTGENRFTHYGNYSWNYPGNRDGIVPATNMPTVGQSLKYDGTNYYWQ